MATSGTEYLAQERLYRLAVITFTSSSTFSSPHLYFYASR